MSGDVDFAGGEGRGPAGELGHGLVLRREEGDKPGRAIDGVVKAVPVVGKEHVAGHFTGERSADFLHLGLDDGVPGGPHHGGAAVRLDVVEKAAGALHVRDDRGAGLAG